MKKRTRFMSMVLAVVIAAYGMPLGPAAAAAENAPAEKPTTAMKLEQTNFDDSTGILTMSLFVKPTPGKTVDEGMFTFQVSSGTVMPITKPRVEQDPVDPSKTKVVYEEIYPTGGDNRVAMVGSPTASSALGQLAGCDDVRVVSDNFTDAMDDHYNSVQGGDFDPRYTGILTTRDPSGMLDVHVQFCYDWSVWAAVINSGENTGYAKIMDLYFQCYSGYDPSTHQQLPATSTDALYDKSFRIPQTEQEAADIVSLFYYDKADRTKSMAAGAAGYIEKDPSTRKTGDSFYYYAEPVPSIWSYSSLQTSGTWAFRGGTINKITDASTPGYWYEHMLDAYILMGFDAGLTNTYKNKGATGDADFILPEDNKSTYPRYVIPTKKQWEGDEENAGDKADESKWLPAAYNDPDKNRVQLKYTVYTRLNSNAVTSPEDNIDEFMGDLKWEFILSEDDVSMEDLAYEITDDCQSYTMEGLDETGQKVTLSVQEAVISNSNGTYCDGGKIQRVSKNGEYWMTTPVGVTLDFRPSQITRTKRDVQDDPDTEVDETAEIVTALAPQLHVTNRAADAKSALWIKNRRQESGFVLIKPSYVASTSSTGDGETVFSSSSMEMRLYKEDPVATTAELTPGSDVGSVKDEDENSQTGFAIGIPVEEGGSGLKDLPATRGVGLTSILYDQYGSAMDDAFTTVTFTPDEDTANKLQQQGKPEQPFQVTQVMGGDEGNTPTHSYTIKYSDGHNVNNAVAGWYELKASYTYTGTDRREHTVEATPLRLYVSKSADFLNYMSSSVSGIPGIGGDVTEGTVNVPRYNSNGSIGLTRANITISELANQWRDPDNAPSDVTLYDAVKGIRRDTLGNIILDSDLTSKGIRVTFTPSIEAGSANGINLETIQTTGSFSFTSATEDGTVLAVRVRAEQSGTGKRVETVYRFTFQRQRSELDAIQITNPGTLTVPKQSVGTLRKTLTVTPLDQYRSSWTWASAEAAYAPGGELNKTDTVYDPWTLYFTDRDGNAISSAAEGITLEGTNKNIAAINYTAPDTSIWVRAKYMNVLSDPVEIRIAKETSIPTTISTVMPYGTERMPAPYAGQLAVDYTPALEVIDQYGDVMDPSKYTMVWRSQSTLAATDAVLDADTGTLSVQPCAKDVDLTLQVTVSSKIQKTFKVSIQRDPATVSTMDITTNKLTYPTTEDIAAGKDSFQLEATGSTQYGVGQSLVGDSAMLWKLESVTLDGDDGNKLTAANNGIKYNSSTRTYEGGVVTLTLDGKVSFKAVAQRTELPTDIVVSATYASTASTDAEDGKIHIDSEAPQPARVYVPETSYSGGLRVPEAGHKSSLTLSAQVRDQYDIPNTDWAEQVEYTVVGSLPAGVTQSGATFEIDNTSGSTPAAYGSFTVRASYAGKSTDCTIYVLKADAEVGSVEVNGVKENGGANTIEMPDAMSSGSTANLRFTVKDQFGTVMGGAVNWTYSDSYGIVRSIDASGRMRLQYSAAAYGDAKAGTAKVRVTATSDADPTKSGYADLTITLAPSKPAYAKPTVDDYGTQERGPNGETLTSIPETGTNTMRFSAQVYDQYEQVMPGEEAVLTLITQDRGFTFTQDEGASTASLVIEPKATTLSVKVKAVPKNNLNGTLDGTDTAVANLNRGVSRIAGLMLDFNVNETYPAPQWSSEVTADQKTGENYLSYTLSAMIVDQYEGKINSTQTKPVWKLETGDAEDGSQPAGVKFADGTPVNANGEFVGDTVELWVYNYAVPQGQTSATIPLKVWTQNKPAAGDDKDYSYDVNLKVTKDPSTLGSDGKPLAKFMYFDGVNAEGQMDPGLSRPDVTTGAVTLNTMPGFFDAYGFPVGSEKAQLEMDTAVVRNQGALVEMEFERGQSEENGDLPLKYTVYTEESEEATHITGGNPEDPQTHVNRAAGSGQRVVMAEYDRITGELTVYNTCTLNRLEFIAQWEGKEGRPGARKRLVVPIENDALQARYIRIGRGHPTAYEIPQNSLEDQSERVSATVYDQYGGAYWQTDVQVQWKLKIRGEDGLLTDYTGELDENGNERLSVDYLVQKTDDPDTDKLAYITVQGRSFFEEKTVVLVAELRQYGAKIGEDVTDIVVKEARSGGIGAGGGITLFFDAGEKGKLVGQDMLTVEPGAKPEKVPGVKTDIGWGFLGWTIDGKDLVNPAEMIFLTDTTFRAVYKDITPTAFLNGYEDGTVRPDKEVTRAEFLKMLVLAAEIYDKDQNYGASFPDVPQDKWYANYIALAKRLEITQGYPDGTFRPDDLITRAEAAQLITAATTLPAAGHTKTFTDVADNMWYKAAVQKLSASGIVDGYPDGTFRPDKNILREEAVKMLVMTTKNAPKGLELTNIQQFAYCPFTDIRKNKWSFAYIVRGAGIA